LADNDCWQKVGIALDPITVEVIGSAFSSLVEEMGMALITFEDYEEDKLEHKIVVCGS